MPPRGSGGPIIAPTGRVSSRSIPWVYAEIVRNLARVEQVNILVNHEAAEAVARDVLVTAEVLPKSSLEPGSRSGNVKFWHIPHQPRMAARLPDRPSSAAQRDRRQANPAVAGGGFMALQCVGEVQRLEAGRAGLRGTRPSPSIPTWQPEVDVNGKLRRVVLEGGSIDVNGRGTLLTTEECLLSDVQQRNPGVSREQLERLFADYLGIAKSSGWDAALPATILTGTLMTFPDSSHRTL